MGQTQRVAILGRGSIGTEVARAIESGEIPGYRLVAILSRRDATPLSAVPLVSSLEDVMDYDPDLVVEAASVDAYRAMVPSCLAAGKDVLAISVAAMAHQDTEDRVRHELSKGNSSLLLASGAIAALDALTAAREGGLSEVTVVQRKPASALLDPDQASKLVEPLVIKRATAREVALEFPRNSNIVAAAALAGLGFDQTNVTVIADPTAQRNSVELQASGNFGELKLTMANFTSPSNPRTALIPAMSMIAALRRRKSPFVIPA